MRGGARRVSRGTPIAPGGRYERPERLRRRGVRAVPRSAAPAGGGLQQGRRILPGGAPLPRPPRSAPAARAEPPRAGRSRDRAPAREERRPRAIHRARVAAGPKRGAVLPRAGGAPPRAAPDRVHADGRSGLPALQPHHAARARHLDHAGRPRRDPADAEERADAGRAVDRRDGQRAHPRARRSGRRRHGHPDRQARALHRGGPASRRHRRCR